MRVGTSAPPRRTWPYREGVDPRRQESGSQVQCPLTRGDSLTPQGFPQPSGRGGSHQPETEEPKVFRRPQCPGLQAEAPDGTTCSDHSQHLPQASKLPAAKGSCDSSRGTHPYRPVGWWRVGGLAAAFASSRSPSHGPAGPQSGQLQRTQG